MGYNDCTTEDGQFNSLTSGDGRENFDTEVMNDLQDSIDLCD